MRIKITERQLEAIVAEARNHVTMRSKQVKSGPTKSHGESISKVVREEKPLAEAKPQA